MSKGHFLKMAISRVPSASSKLYSKQVAYVDGGETKHIAIAQACCNIFDDLQALSDA